MWHLGRTWEDETALARTWREAVPFPHLVFDDFVADAAMADLLALLGEEPIDEQRSELFRFEASPVEPRTEGLRALREELAGVLGPPLARITGKPLRRVEMRLYAYRRGHYLLPHSDHQTGVGRALAFAYYVPSPEPPSGGELELFRCSTAPGTNEVITTESERIIEPRSNRLVVFDVGDLSLHQVREITDGARLSLSGWFYP